MRIHSFFIPLAFVIVSCSPRVIPSFQKTYPPSVSSPQDVVVVENKTVKAVPENAELLGSVRVTDTGFTSKKTGPMRMWSTWPRMRPGRQEET